MTTMQLNAELFRQLSIIADDESLMRKAVKAITRLARKKEEEIIEEQFVSKEEFLAGIDAGLKDIKAGRKQPFDEFIKEMEDAV